MKGKPRIAVLAGGYSGEADVSRKSAKTIFNHLDQNRFEVYLVEVGNEGWTVQDVDGTHPVDLHSLGFKKDGQEFRFDYAFIMVHGSPGEDGRIQGFLDMHDLPYSTGDVLCMAWTFNKARTQLAMKDIGVRIAKNMAFQFGEDRPSDEEIIESLGLPCFVKPTESGSSIGVSKVDIKEGLASAIEHAFSVHPEVLIESMVHGRELACGVYRDSSGVHPLPVTEIVSTRDFFDYEAKYEDEATQEITPADIPATAYTMCQELTKRIYEHTRCKGIARVDFFLSENKLYFIEINTVPGMSQESLVPKQLKSAEIELRELLTDMILHDLSQKKKR